MRKFGGLVVIAVCVALLALIAISGSRLDGAERPWLDSFHAKWVGNVLNALQEPRLHAKAWDEKTEVYRLIAMPTFSHPISVRVTSWPTGGAGATTRMSSGWGGYDPGKLNFERATLVSSENLEALRNAFVEIDFWSLPTKTPPTRIEHPDGMVEMIICTDGTTIVIEAIAGGRYHIIHRHCDQREQLRPVVEVFERIAGRELMPLPPDEDSP
jgi:hypothetical protein